jgi:heme oxygenase (biliverdin-producing, ferredoxin)
MSLKELTAEAHKQAETQPFVKLIFSGSISKEDYARYLFNQELVYATLELFAQSAGILDDLPGIKRAEKIRDDLIELEVPLLDEPLPSVDAYLNHLASIQHDPKKLMSHIYVRHMGDLFGGQMIAKKVPGSGQFYKFENADTLKTAIRAKLDDSLADEALVCFGFATNLFEELVK